MCGIYGYVSKDTISNYEEDIFTKLSSSAEIRGKEACGFALISEQYSEVLKFNTMSSKAYKDKEVKTVLKNFFKEDGSKVLMGHSRLQTNGTRDDNLNNQPVVYNENILLHNGIICNHESLSETFEIERESDLDSEYLIKRFNVLSTKMNPEMSLGTLFEEIEGEATIAIYENDNLHLVTNCGNLYYLYFDNSSELVFASEKYFLEELNLHSPDNKINKLEPGKHLMLNIKTSSISFADVNLSKINTDYSYKPIEDIQLKKKSFWKNNSQTVCTKGILNERMPGIKFDHDGISNIAKYFKPYETKETVELENKLAEHKKENGKDILVGFSGGRDSSYMLHLLKNKYEMNPIAVTYDWGMVTDLARRNQARMCGHLGVEHIIVAADIPEKRKNINLYLNAWLKNPHLGMVPLLMAGDKKYFQAITDTAKKNNISLVGFGSAPYEFTSFKTGFAGVIDSFEKEKNLKNILQASNNFSKLRLSLFYVKQVLGTPSYLNKGLLDAMFAFKHSYFDKKNYLQFFEYENWDENEINEILISNYGWESDPTIPSTWRIGDGTAPFYNFIYRSLAGFTEHDTFRNNQVLSGVLKREDALNIVKAENEPRFEKIHEYLDLINMDFDRTINRILDFSPYVDN
ncbi:hypothetical protein N9V51_02440 [Candidatus Actinomarina sp.]|nr:hypothetical protein [Candidatus Actinomarina sp.]